MQSRERRSKEEPMPESWWRQRRRASVPTGTHSKQKKQPLCRQSARYCLQQSGVAQRSCACCCRPDSRVSLPGQPGRFYRSRCSQSDVVIRRHHPEQKRLVGESAFTKSGEHFRRLLDERKPPGDIKLIYLRDAIRSNGTLDGMLLRDIRSRMRFSMLSISSRLLVRRYSSQRE